MRIELICIGSELLTGKQNTHCSFFSKTLQTIGLTVSEEHTVPDILEDIEYRIKQSFARSDMVFVCGGLGPTFDDITREAAARALKKKLICSTDILEKIKKRTREWKSSFSDHEKKQAYVIEGAEPLVNEIGVA
ncbi:MAG: molybdopterin-binding protein, partial [bacterium]